MPPLPSTSASGRPRPDAIKDSILRESTAGWANGTTPLRIAKRDSPSVPSPNLPSGARNPVARRSSNSFKHVFTNNLVSKSPFKSQIAAPARSSPRQPLGVGSVNTTVSITSPRTPRKVSGEKRARPDSLIQQAEQENALRVKELGFKRRQSKGFQGLVEREVVSKSPFKRVVGGTFADTQHEDALSMPIAIEFPMQQDGESTSPDTTETESSLNSKENMYMNPSAAESESPLRPLTPPQRPIQTRASPSPGFERRSPVPSALQGSPARSSLVQKARLLGPRSRSLSAGASSAADTPTRQRRKTVTFDERCDVVEFDRESHEGSVFETDDEEVYGARERHSNDNFDSSADSSAASAEYATADYATPTHSPRRIVPEFDAKLLDDSINGLVDSMLQEASGYDAEPSTPPMRSNSLSSVVADMALMTGGAENGVPYGGSHHAERAEEYHHFMDDERDAELPIPAPYSQQREEETVADVSDSEPSFASIGLSTPPPTHTPQSHYMNDTHGSTPLPMLPPDTERVEDGIPLGRTHHADRARAAHASHASGADPETRPLPSSPSPMKKPAPPVNEHDMMDSEMPKFDLGINGFRTSSPRANSVRNSPRNEDIFGSPKATRDILAELEFNHPNIDPEVLSNTSIASFHEFPQPDFNRSTENCALEDHEDEDERYENEYEKHERSVDLSFGRHSNLSLDASIVSIVNDLNRSQRSDSGETQYLHRERTQTTGTDSTTMEVGRGEEQMRLGSPVSRLASPLLNPNRNSADDFSPSHRDQPRSPVGLYDLEDGRGSQSSPMGSESGRNRSPRIDRDDIMRRLNRQRSAESMSHIGSPQPASPRVEDNYGDVGSSYSRPMLTEPKAQMGEMSEVKLSATPPLPSSPPPTRPSLEERLKRALSPTLAAPAPLRLTPPLSVSPANLSKPPSAFASQSASPLPAPVPIMAESRHSFDESMAYTPARPKMHPRIQSTDMACPSPLAPSFDFGKPGVDIGEIDMRSALDRLVDDVSIAGGVEGKKMTIGGLPELEQSGMAVSSGDVSLAETELITEEGTELLAGLRESLRGHGRTASAPAQPMQRAYTAPEPTMPSRSPAPAIPSPRINTALDTLPRIDVEEESPPPPPVPPKTPEKSARQAREEMIKEKRRIARGRESGEYFVPPRRDGSGNLLEESPASKRYSSGRRPSARRSMSMGEIEDCVDSDGNSRRRISVMKNMRGGVLGMALEDDEVPLTDSIEKELKGRAEPRHKKTYELREREDIVYASSSSQEGVMHMNQVGDLSVDKAWRTVRRPSDINEYARQIKEYRAKEGSGKLHGKLFVKVIGITSMRVPIPPETTLFSCTLNNGIHFVTTPDTRFAREARIEQEFELIEHGKLEFTLTLKIKRDPHIVQQFKTITPPAPTPPPPVVAPVHRSGMRSFFGGSPKKPKVPKHNRSQTEPIARFVMQDNLARYLKPDGTLARAFIAFKDVADRCNMRLFETSMQLIGQRLDAPGEGGGVGGTMVPKPVGEIVVQLFRLPPLPGVPSNQLPQSLEECHLGLRNVRWHKETYHEGVLTQLGGDCSTWRRRQFRVIGGSLVAFNDVTKRAIATIDLKKAISVEDDQDRDVRKRDIDDFDNIYGVERSFRLTFPRNQEITFFADTDEEKARWLEVFHALIGRIPPHPLWAELLWTQVNDPSIAAALPPPRAGEDYPRMQR